jgi:hypothetical protein
MSDKDAKNTSPTKEPPVLSDDDDDEEDDLNIEAELA